MSAAFRRLADSHRFQNFITAVILFAGVLVGIETYPSLVDHAEEDKRKREQGGAPSLEQELDAMEHQLDALKEKLVALRRGHLAPKPEQQVDPIERKAG